MLWKNQNISRIILGTAQLGMDYGIANRNGKPPQKQAFKIIETAWKNGIDYFDTAQGYGNSELIIGQALKSCGISSSVKIISKISPALEPTDSIQITQAIEKSCRHLRIDCLWGMMLHRSEWLNKWEYGLGEVLSKIKKRGVVKYLGVSVYTAKEAKRALKQSDIDIIQVPCNAWDQRMKNAGIFELARAKNKICLIRSVYLQGLLTMSCEEVTSRLSFAQKASEQWHKLALEYNLKPVELAIKYALSLGLPLVIGVESFNQIEENIFLAKQPVMAPERIKEIHHNMASFLNEDILDPRLWKKSNKMGKGLINNE